MMKNTGYIATLCLIASGHAFAHDVWITGKQVQNNVIGEIGYGHNFPFRGTLPDRRDLFENPRLYNGKETITLKPTSTDYVYKAEVASKETGYVLLTHMKPGYWSRTSSGWKPVSREGRNDVFYCEYVTKYAKSFIPGEQGMPAQLYLSPIGHELEIIPLSDISRFSEDVKLKVLYKTSPLAGAILELDSVNYLTSSRHTRDQADEHKHPVHKAEITFISNGYGIVTVPSLHVGQWMAKVKNKKKFPDKSLCDETVDVTTLSFFRN